MKKTIKSKYGYFTDKNTVVLTEDKPKNNNYLTKIKIKLDKNFKLEAKQVNKVKFSFDKPIENIENMNLVVDFENIVKKRSIFSMFKKQKHVKSGTYNKVNDFEYITNNLNIFVN